MGVATAVAIGGLAISAGSSAISFIQAGKQKKLQQEAEADAQRAMAEARKKLDINFYREMGIQKEPYELAREAQLAQGAATLQAAQEGERGVGTVAGQLQMAQNAAQADIRTAMGKEQRDIQQMVLDEESRLRDVQTQLDLEEVAGAQQAAADAQMARAQFVTEGMQSAANALQQGLSLLPLYAGGGDGDVTTTPTTQQRQGVGYNPRTFSPNLNLRPTPIDQIGIGVQPQNISILPTQQPSYITNPFQLPGTVQFQPIQFTPRNRFTLKK